MNILIIIFLTLFLEYILLYLVYKFILSDTFVNKTGIKTYYMENGKKKCINSVNIVISTLIMILPFSIFVLLRTFLNEYIFSWGFLIYVLLFSYISLILLIREKYYPFNNEIKKDTKSKILTYTSISLKLNALINLSIVLFLGIYFILNINFALLCFFVMFCYLNIFTIVPDLLNKVWPLDIRTRYGWYSYLSSYLGLLGVMLLIIYKLF